MLVMMKGLALASAALMLVSAAPPRAPAPAAASLAPNSTLTSSGIPPARYQGDNVAAVFFVRDVAQICGRAPTGYVVLACAQGDKIAMPNPCPFAATERYARIMCHELAHVSGWPATHGD